MSSYATERHSSSFHTHSQSSSQTHPLSIRRMQRTSVQPSARNTAATNEVFSVTSPSSTNYDQSLGSSVQRQSTSSISDEHGSRPNGSKTSNPLQAERLSDSPSQDNPAQILIASVVQRIVKRLPHNTGEALYLLQDDALFRTTVAALITHSKTQLTTIVREILPVFDSLSKVSHSMGEDRVSVDVMQSQLLMLQVLVACLQYSWTCHSAAQADTISSTWPDPPAFDDGLAKQVLAAMTVFLKQLTLREESYGSDFRVSLSTSDKSRPKDDELESSADATFLAGLCLEYGTGLFVLHPVFPAKRPPFELDQLYGYDTPPQFRPDASASIVSFNAGSQTSPSEPGQGSSPRSLGQSMYRQASNVIFYLSSSNWPVIHARVKNRLAYLSASQEDIPNTSELRILECTYPNVKRLSNVMQDVCGTFAQLKRPAQFTLAASIRRMIWNWIRYSPSDFATLHLESRRIEGAEELFDLAAPLPESTKKRFNFWPMLTTLLLISPDLIKRVILGDARKTGTFGKKTAFLDTLRKSIRSNKLADVATLCCVDIQKAAAGVKPSETALHQLAKDLQSDLHDKLFDPRKQQSYTLHSIEVPITADALVAAFRIDAQKAVKELLPIFVGEDRLLINRIILAKAMTLLASEQHAPTRQAIMSLLYPHTGVMFRSIFKDLVFRACTSESADTSARKIRQRAVLQTGTQEDATTRQEMLFSLLQLWRADIGAAAYGLKTGGETSFKSLAAGATIFDEDAVFRNAVQKDSYTSFFYVVGRASRTIELWPIHKKAGDVLGNLIDHRNAGLASFTSAIESGLALATDFCRCLAQTISECQEPNVQRHWLKTLQGALARKDVMITMEIKRKGSLSAQPYLPSLEEVELEIQEIEKALLLTLSSVDTLVCSASLQACGMFAKYRKQIAVPYRLNKEWTAMFEELGALDTIFIGRIAQQKRIRTCLRNAPACSNAIVQAWREAYARWGALTQIVARPLAENSSDAAQDKAAQWHNLAGFLAALGGSCAVNAWPEVSQRERKTNTVIKHSETPLQLVESFVQEMVDLLVSDSVWVREKIKETLGTDISLQVNGVLLRMVHSVLSDFFDKSTGQPRPTDVYSVFVEHSISVIQMVLGRITEPTEATLNVDIGALMVLFVEYLHAALKRDQAYRTRTLVCQLCEAFMLKKHLFMFSNEVRVRNRIFQVLCGWTTDSIDDSISNIDKHGKAQYDLDVACLRTMAVLLNKLPLQLPEDTPLLEESAGWAQSRQFSSYFTFFLKVLNRARTMDEKAQIDDTTSSNASSKRHKDQDAMTYAPLKTSAITALSNLLAANIKTGLNQSLPLAYSEDLQIRTAFMQIMTNVLNQGLAFDQLEKLDDAEKPNKLVELISEPDLQLALAVCNICKGYDDDGMDYILLNIFDSKGGINRFLKAALQEEIERTTTEEMVFRSNTFRTHLLSTFGKTHGYDYLRSIIEPLVTDMAGKARNYSYEIDTQKLEQGENVLVNQHRLEEVAQAFIDQICSSAHRVPAVMRDLCRHIRLLMDRRFPTSRYQGVGGFVFLRFINPAVVAPQNVDVDVGINSKEVRRGLLLVSKILQTLASNTLFPQHKEPFMTALNDFLKKNVWKVTTFLDAVSDARTDPDRLAAADQPLGYGIQPYGFGIDAEDQGTLQRFVVDNATKLRNDIASRHGTTVHSDEGIPGAAPDIETAEIFDASRLQKRLDAVLKSEGDAKSEDNMINIFADHNNRRGFQEFMRKHHGKSLDEELFKTIFRPGAPSKAGRPVFYLTLAHLASQTLNFESFIFYVIQTLQSCVNQPYDIVIDCTAAQSFNLPPHQWANYFATLIPRELVNNLRNVIGFNVNMCCKLWLRPWRSQTDKQGHQRTNSTPLPQANVNFVICASLSELETYIERSNIALDALTMATCTASKDVELEHITMVWYYRILVPVVFRITDRHLHVASQKAQPVLSNTSGKLNEVIHLSEIEDVRAVSIRGDDNTFFITCREGSTSFLFLSRSREEIVQALRQARASVSRFDRTQAQGNLDRTLLPSDVPGTLLNMALLNVTSDDRSLRVGAYDLLCALSSSFNFGASKARNRLLSAKGVSLPFNTLNFVMELSKEFAAAAPGVTLEFLLSFLEGFERSPPKQKVTCLQYIAPWIPNLLSFMHTSRERQAECARRVKDLVSLLIAITVKERDLYATMQRSIWLQFTKLDELIPLVLDVFVEAAMDCGIDSERFELVLNTMATFASINLRGKLLAKLRRAISKTAHEDAAWKEIGTIARINAILSFSSRTETELFLPEILQTILLLVGTGDMGLRTAIYNTTINLVHSLCTKERDSDEGQEQRDDSNAQLRLLLVSLSSSERKAQFGLVASKEQIVADAGDTSIAQVSLEEPSNEAIAVLAHSLYSIIDAAAPTTDTANAWRARLTSLVTSTAFQYNPAIQTRAFMLLGCLAELTAAMLEAEELQYGNAGRTSLEPPSIFEIDDDLLYQILVSLRGSIQEWSLLASDAPIVSIVTCLSKIVRLLPDHSRYLAQMFWLGVSIIQYGHLPLFKCAVDLMETTVSSICARRLPQAYEADLIAFLLDGRVEFLEAARRLDDETGVDFEIKFSFALSALLVKGLSNTSTNESTVKLLRTMLQHTAIDAAGRNLSGDGRVAIEVLGFFVALLPTCRKAEDLGALLELAGVPASVAARATEQRSRGETLRNFDTSKVMPSSDEDGKEAAVGLYTYIKALETKTALLVVTLISALLQQNVGSNSDRQLLYSFMADSARLFPAIVSILYSHLLPIMREVYLNNQTDEIVRSVDAIAQIAISEPIFHLQIQETRRRGGVEAYLDESGYACLLDCGTFIALKDVRRVALAKLSIAMLGGLIDAGTA